MNTKRSLPGLALLLSLAGCAAAPPDGSSEIAEQPQAAAAQALQQSYRPAGQAGLDRLQQSEMQALCSQYEGQALPAEISLRLMEEARGSVIMPADGQFLGDWHAGEVVAKSGVGLQSSDDPAIANGGNCYACHEMAAEEIAWGTLGPSLKQYGSIRGRSPVMLEFTWTRLWNAHAYNACSHMPRFGDAGILTEQQLKDVMAYLFDPASPVNQDADGDR